MEVTGTVLEMWSRAPISGVAVTADGHVTSTDPSGRFSLDLPPGTYTIRFVHADYETATRSVVVTSPTDIGTVYLKPIFTPL
ncbi:MAG: hypothetical protein DRP12_00130 [Candidatus Aenigmatarchaeota archaeon]|nr:MAG: hypothetical protein DRP12_00130 [Candidatus Aenigmarchaeota archaeon]